MQFFGFLSLVSIATTSSTTSDLFPDLNPATRNTNILQLTPRPLIQLQSRASKSRRLSTTRPSKRGKMGRKLSLHSGSRLQSFQVFPLDLIHHDHGHEEKDSVDRDRYRSLEIATSATLLSTTSLNNTCINVRRNW